MSILNEGPEEELPTIVVVLNDTSGVYSYQAASHEAALSLYLKIQAKSDRQICYLRDKDGKDFRVVPYIAHTVQRIGITKDVHYGSTVGHVLHDAQYVKREKK